MCGITGIFVFNSDAESHKAELQNATTKLGKRGPDSQDVFFHNSCGLGHARLSIIDVSSQGNQPFTDNTGRYTIVYNGEFYNYQKYKEELQGLGYTFRSTSDTEVLLYLYIHYKEACLEKINGFFAFAVYDKEEQTLFFARDRFGIKPVLYSMNPDFFVFGSEMKAITSYAAKKEIDWVSAHFYFHLNYIPFPNSIFSDVKKLEPGSYGVVKKSGEFETKKWYQLPFPLIKNQSLDSYEVAQKKMVSLLHESVEKRLVSDVPLGTFLSGGIDSSIITTIASKSIKDLHTFSIGYQDEPLFDETYYANLVANKLKTNHNVFSLSNEDLFENIHEILDYIDEPFADSSAIAVYILCKKTQKHVSVALSGDGADEVFSGYNKHLAEYRARNSQLLAPLLKSASPFLPFLPKSRNSKIGNLSRQLSKFTEGISLSEKERYWRWAGFAKTQNDNNLLLKEVDKKELDERKELFINHIEKSQGINDVLFADVNLVLANDMLTKVDLMSMANSLEVRVPFLDHNLVEYVFSLPSEYKIDGKMKKKIVQDAFRNELPAELYNRKKHGFEVPLLNWFKTEYKANLDANVFNKKRIEEQGVFRWDAVQALQQKLLSRNPEDAVATTWALVVFQYWWNKNMQS